MSEFQKHLLQPLLEDQILNDPIEQFQKWFEIAQQSQEPEPTAMTLATITQDSRPAARVVLLKGVDLRGFVFYTNYQSRKAQELKQNPHAALAIRWASLDRQVRIEGRVETVSAEESDRYFQSRPRGSQLGAWASPQSQVLANREVLEGKMHHFTEKFNDQDIPRPPHWGGYRVIPDLIEFWQSRPDRLHDRIQYRKTEDGTWIFERLAP